MEEPGAHSSSASSTVDIPGGLAALLLPSKDFPQRRREYREWFRDLADDERNALLRDQLELAGPSQIHTLSSLLEPRLHEDCPPNCQVVPDSSSSTA